MVAAHLAVGVLWGDNVAPDVCFFYFFFNIFTIFMGAQITSDVRTRYTDRVKINQPFPNMTTGVCTLILIEMLNHLRAQPAF